MATIPQVDEQEQRPAAPGPERRWPLEAGDEVAPGLTMLSRLGGGHRYEAYLSWSEQLHVPVVVKLVRPHLVDDEHTLAGLAAEAAMLERLNHPVILRGFGARLDGARPHVVLEHLEGPRLSTLLRRQGPLAAEQLVPLALQIAAALHYMAGEGVIHLDVKPANVIMGAPPRLIDLSVAITVAEGESLRQPIGTDSYMAPEQCNPVELGPVGPPADVWGLGATLYRAASGERAFGEPARDPASPAERWPQLVREPEPLEGRVRADLAEPILACLRRDPAERPSPAELHAQLEPVLAALPRPKLAGLKPRWR